MDRDYEGFFASVFGGMVSLFANIYHFIFAFQDGIAFFPLSNLYHYEAPIDSFLSIAGCCALAAVAIWIGTCLELVASAIKPAVGVRPK